MNHLGIDIAKASFDATLRLESGAEQYKRFENSASGFSQLKQWLECAGVTEVHACMEATNVYWEELAEYLYQQGYGVSVVNPTRTKGFGMSKMQRNKTDKVDSQVIAAFCAANSPQFWQPPTAEERKLRALVRHREGLLKTKIQQTNRLTDCRDEDVQRSLQSVIAMLEAEIKQIEQQIRTFINQNPTLKERKALLLSIPGVGEVTTHVIMAEMYDLPHYENAHAAAADAGVHPAHYESGVTVRRRSTMSKEGKASVRSVLFLPAMTAIRTNPLVHALAQRLEQRGKSKMVIIGAAMRKLIHIAYGVLKNNRPFDPLLLSPSLVPS